MIETILFLGLFGAELLSQTVGWSGFFLLLYAPFLFYRRYSVRVVLLGAAGSTFLSEMMHGYYAGSLMLGVGLALFCLHWTAGVIEWGQPVVQVIGLVLYFVITLVTRSVLLYAAEGLVVLPRLLPWILTLLVGTGLVALNQLLRTRQPVRTPDS